MSRVPFVTVLELVLHRPAAEKTRFACGLLNKIATTPPRNPTSSLKKHTSNPKMQLRTRGGFLNLKSKLHFSFTNVPLAVQ